MRPPPRRRARLCRHRLGRLLALLALAVQLAAASVVLPQAAGEAAALDRLVAASICHGTPTAPHYHHAPAPVCPLLQAVAQAGALLAATPPLLAAPAVAVMRISLPPPARAPPPRAIVAAYPRGPPLPV